jgi:hypothetical protein
MQRLCCYNTCKINQLERQHYEYQRIAKVNCIVELEDRFVGSSKMAWKAVGRWLNKGSTAEGAR